MTYYFWLGYDAEIYHEMDTVPAMFRTFGW
jgi:hypothetical protein